MTTAFPDAIDNALEEVTGFESYILEKADQFTDLADPPLDVSLEYRRAGFTGDESSAHWRNACRASRFRRIAGTAEQRHEMQEHLSTCKSRLASEGPKLDVQIDQLRKKLDDMQRVRDGLDRDVAVASKRIDESAVALQDLKNLGCPRWLFRQHSILHERIRNVERNYFGDGYDRADMRLNELNQLIEMKPPTEQDDLARLDRKWGHMFAVVDATDVGSDRNYRLNSSGFSEWKKWLKSKLPEIEKKEAAYQAEIAPLRAMQDQLQQIYYADLLEPPAQPVVQDESTSVLPSIDQQNEPR